MLEDKKYIFRSPGRTFITMCLVKWKIARWTVAQIPNDLRKKHCCGRLQPLQFGVALGHNTCKVTKRLFITSRQMLWPKVTTSLKSKLWSQQIYFSASISLCGFTCMVLQTGIEAALVTATTSIIIGALTWWSVDSGWWARWTDGWAETLLVTYLATATANLLVLSFTTVILVLRVSAPVLAGWWTTLLSWVVVVVIVGVTSGETSLSLPTGEEPLAGETTRAVGTAWKTEPSVSENIWCGYESGWCWDNRDKSSAAKGLKPSTAKAICPCVLFNTWRSVL